MKIQFSTWILLIVVVNISSMHRFLFIIISSDLVIINEMVKIFQVGYSMSTSCEVV